MAEMRRELLGKAVGGDEQALTALLEEHAPELRRRLAGGIPKRWRALLSEDDVLQQTYVDAFRDIRRFVGDQESAFRGWLETLPPKKFEFQGFVVITATEVTDQAVTSALKDDLLQKDIENFQRGNILNGRVVGKAGDDVVIDVGPGDGCKLKQAPIHIPPPGLCSRRQGQSSRASFYG